MTMEVPAPATVSPKAFSRKVPTAAPEGSSGGLRLASISPQLLTFGVFVGRLGACFAVNRIRRVFNSAADSRNLARRIALCQVVFTLAVALVFGLVVGANAALGALVGGAGLTLGSALMAWRSLSGGVRGAGGALLRMLGGLAIKWCVVVLVLYLALVQWGLPSLAVLSGVLAAVAASVVAVGFKSAASSHSNLNQSASNQGSRRGG